jgi:hypothetical protein
MARRGGVPGLRVALNAVLVLNAGSTTEGAKLGGTIRQGFLCT